MLRPRCARKGSDATVGHWIYTAFASSYPRWRGLLWALLTFLPFAAWQLVIRLWLGEWGVGSGGALSSSFELIPLRGWWVMAMYDVASFAAMSLLVLPLAIFSHAGRPGTRDSRTMASKLAACNLGVIAHGGNGSFLANIKHSRSARPLPFHHRVDCGFLAIWRAA